jgi:hypothetical protein
MQQCATNPAYVCRTSLGGCQDQKRKEETMRAAVFRGAFAIQVEQIPDATILAPTDAVVRITHAYIL